MDTLKMADELNDKVLRLKAINAQLLEALEAIGEGRTLIMDDLGETLADALMRDARETVRTTKSGP